MIDESCDSDFGIIMRDHYYSTNLVTTSWGLSNIVDNMYIINGKNMLINGINVTLI